EGCVRKNSWMLPTNLPQRPDLCEFGKGDVSFERARNLSQLAEHPNRENELMFSRPFSCNSGKRFLEARRTLATGQADRHEPHPKRDRARGGSLETNGICERHNET